MDAQDGGHRVHPSELEETVVCAEGWEAVLLQDLLCEWREGEGEGERKSEGRVGRREGGREGGRWKSVREGGRLVVS